MAAAKLTAWQSKIAGEFERMDDVNSKGIYTWGRPVYKRTSGTKGWDIIKWDSLRMHWVPFGTLNLALTLALALESTLTLALALESTLTLAPALLLSSLNLTLTPTLTHTRRSMASITLSRGAASKATTIPWGIRSQWPRTRPFPPVAAGAPPVSPLPLTTAWSTSLLRQSTPRRPTSAAMAWCRSSTIPPLCFTYYATYYILHATYYSAATAWWRCPTVLLMPKVYLLLLKGSATVLTLYLECYLLLSTFYFLLLNTTCYLLPATCYLLPATYYPPGRGGLRRR